MLLTHSNTSPFRISCPGAAKTIHPSTDLQPLYSSKCNWLERFMGIARASRKVSPHFPFFERAFLQIESPTNLAHFVKANTSFPVVQSADDSVFERLFAAHSEDYLFKLKRRIL